MIIVFPWRNTLTLLPSDKRKNPVVTFDILKFNLIETPWDANRQEVYHGPWTTSVDSRYMEHLCAPDTWTTSVGLVHGSPPVDPLHGHGSLFYKRPNRND